MRQCQDHAKCQATSSIQTDQPKARQLNIFSRYWDSSVVVDDRQSAHAVVLKRQRLTDNARTGNWGAWPWTQVNIMTPSLNTTRSGTSSQFSFVCRSRDKPQSNLVVTVTRQAAAINTCRATCTSSFWRKRQDSVAVINSRPSFHFLPIPLHSIKEFFSKF